MSVTNLHRTTFIPTGRTAWMDVLAALAAVLAVHRLGQITDERKAR